LDKMFLFSQITKMLFQRVAAGAAFKDHITHCYAAMVMTSFTSF
jgi:hypothetical protein